MLEKTNLYLSAQFCFCRHPGSHVLGNFHKMGKFLKSLKWKTGDRILPGNFWGISCPYLSYTRYYIKYIWFLNEYKDDWMNDLKWLDELIVNRKVGKLHVFIFLSLLDFYKANLLIFEDLEIPVQSEVADTRMGLSNRNNSSCKYAIYFI